MIRRLHKRRRKNREAEQFALGVGEKPAAPKTVPFETLQSNVYPPFPRQNVVRDKSFPFLLTLTDGTEQKIWIEAETYAAAFLKAQGIAEQAWAKVTELW